MSDITESITKNDVAAPMRHLLKDREKSKKYNYSIYREILFLSIYSLEREYIDTGINKNTNIFFFRFNNFFVFKDAFDREYRLAFTSLKPKIQELVKPFDKWPNNTSVWCRRLFSPLYL
jgi:hypothetical protein